MPEIKPNNGKVKVERLVPRHPHPHTVYDYRGFCLVKLPEEALYHIFISDFEKCGWPAICDCRAHSPNTLCGIPRLPCENILMGQYNPAVDEVCTTCLGRQGLHRAG